MMPPGYRFLSPSFGSAFSGYGASQVVLLVKRIRLPMQEIQEMWV